MPRCKAPEILRNEAYFDVRRNKPAPCLTRGRMRAPPQMDVFQQPDRTLYLEPQVEQLVEAQPLQEELAVLLNFPPLEKAKADIIR